MLDRLEALAARWPVLATPVAVQRRFGEVHGSYLAAAVTLAAFLSLFPLLLVAIAVLGFLGETTETLAADVVEGLGLPPDGPAAELVEGTMSTARESRRAASLTGLLGLLWTGLGLVSALQYAYNSAWQVTGRGLRDKAVGLGWLVGAALLFASSLAVTTAIGVLPGGLAPLQLGVGLGLSFGLFLWTAKVLCHRDVGWRALVPGAVLGAVGLEALKLVGSIYVPRAVASSSALYGSIGVVFAVLAWLWVFGRLVVYSAVLNVVRWEQRHGTVSIEVRAPKLPGATPLEGTRSGETTVAAEPPAKADA
jgi:membrane protein